MGAEDVPSGVEAAGEAEQATTHQMAGDEADPHRAQDAGATLLAAVDDRVDKALVSTQKVVSDNAAFLTQQIQKQKEFHAQNLEAYKTARDNYLKKVEDAVEYVKQHGLSESAHKAANEVLARVGEAQAAVLATPGLLLGRVVAAVEALLAFGPVHSAVEAVKPSLGAAQGQYMRMHDSLVASTQYKQAYALAGGLAQRAQSTWVYAKVKENLFPLAEPAYNTVVASPYYSRLVQHLQPLAGSA